MLLATASLGLVLLGYAWLVLFDRQHCKGKSLGSMRQRQRLQQAFQYIPCSHQAGRLVMQQIVARLLPAIKWSICSQIYHGLVETV